MKGGAKYKQALILISSSWLKDKLLYRDEYEVYDNHLKFWVCLFFTELIAIYSDASFD
jgi:hypothetical protein